MARTSWYYKASLLTITMVCWSIMTVFSPSAVEAAVGPVPFGQVLAQDDFTTETNLWDYAGNAQRTGDSVQLTPASGDKAGLLWFKQPLAPPYNVSFAYRINTPSGSPADGLVFMFNKEKSNTLITGGALSFQPGNGYGVEFDTWPNEGDPTQDHITLFKNNSNHTVAGTKLSQTTDTTIANGNWHNVRVEVTATNVKVYMDSTLRIDWTGTLDNKYNGLGFAASTGGSYSQHLIDNVVITGPSGDATLSSLSMDGQSIVFTPETTSYPVTVPYDTDAAHLRFTLSSPLASLVSVTSSVANAVYGVSGTSASANLSVGPNTIGITVKAENGSTKTYSLQITRSGSNNAFLRELSTLNGEILSPAFQSHITLYELYVPASHPEAYLRFSLSDQLASYTVNGAVYGNGTDGPMASLTPGGPNYLMLDTRVSAYEIHVLAQDRQTAQTYRIQFKQVPEDNLIGFVRQVADDMLEVAFPMPVQLPASIRMDAFHLSGTDAKISEISSLMSLASGTTIKLKLDQAIQPGDNVRLSLLQGAMLQANGTPLLQLNTKVITLSYLDGLRNQLDTTEDGIHIDDVVRFLESETGSLPDKDLNGNGQIDRYDAKILLRLIL